MTLLPETTYVALVANGAVERVAAYLHEWDDPDKYVRPFAEISETDKEAWREVARKVLHAAAGVTGAVSS